MAKQGRKERKPQKELVVEVTVLAPGEGMRECLVCKHPCSKVCWVLFSDAGEEVMLFPMPIWVHPSCLQQLVDMDEDGDIVEIKAELALLVAALERAFGWSVRRGTFLPPDPEEWHLITGA